MPITGFAERLLKIIELRFDGKPSRLSKQAGISTGAFQPYIEGKSIPNGENLLKISQAANVSIDWLLIGEEKSGRQTLQQKLIDYDSAEEREYIEKLKRVLRNPATNKAIRENLDTFIKVPMPSVKKRASNL